eukprot:g4736.t1
MASSSSTSAPDPANLHRHLKEYANLSAKLCGRAWELSSPEWSAAAAFFQQGARVQLKPPVAQKYAAAYGGASAAEYAAVAHPESRWLVVSEEYSSITLDEVEDNPSMRTPPAVVDLFLAKPDLRSRDGGGLLLRAVPVEHLVLPMTDDDLKGMEPPTPLPTLREQVVTDHSAAIFIRSIWTSFRDRPCYGVECFDAAGGREEGKAAVAASEEEEGGSGGGLREGSRTFRWTTFGQSFENMRRLPGALLARGVRPGAFVGFASDISPSLLDLYFGLILGGYVVVPLSVHLTDEHAQHMIHEASVECIFLSPETEARWTKIVGTLPATAAAGDGPRSKPRAPVQVFPCLGGCSEPGLFIDWLRDVRGQWHLPEIGDGEASSIGPGAADSDESKTSTPPQPPPPASFQVVDLDRLGSLQGHDDGGTLQLPFTERLFEGTFSHPGVTGNKKDVPALLHLGNEVTNRAALLTWSFDNNADSSRFSGISASAGGKAGEKTSYFLGRFAAEALGMVLDAEIEVVFAAKSTGTAEAAAAEIRANLLQPSSARTDHKTHAGNIFTRLKKWFKRSTDDGSSPKRRSAKHHPQNGISFGLRGRFTQDTGGAKKWTRIDGRTTCIVGGNESVVGSGGFLGSSLETGTFEFSAQ